ncbi:MAG TPA: MFS transporter [Miltoncostaea sp.]|jgi:MFS family permease|nr:MFS transporter [Miltoncostaea sp.]
MTARPAHPRALAALALATLLSSLGTSIANVALPTLEDAFGTSFSQVQWVVLAYLIAVTALVVVAGRLGDLLGPRRLMVAGIGVFTVASALCAAAPGLWTLVAARALQGLGAAAMVALALVLVTEAVPEHRRGRAMGLLGSMSAAGTALGPSVGGVVIAAADWRAIFLVNVPLGVVAMVLARRHLPADRPGGAAGAVGPLAGVGLLRDRAIAAGIVTSALVSTVVMATLVVGPFHLSRALGLSPALVGLVMSAGPVVVALTGVPAGRIADRVGPRRTTLTGLAAMAAGTLLLAIAPRGAGVPGYLGPILVVTLGYALFQTANTTGVMGAAPADRRGVTSGLLNLSRNLGLITGTALMGAVFAFAAGTGDTASAPAADVATGTRATFALATVLIAAAWAVALAGRPRRSQKLHGSPIGGGTPAG